MLNLVITILAATVPTTIMFAAEPTAPAQPVWRNLGPGGGGWIQSICASPHDRDELFVGCDVGGFYRSADGGGSYRIQNAGLEDYFVECIVLDAGGEPGNRKLVTISRGHGVYRSLDSGRTWQAANSGLELPGLIAGLAVHPADSDVYWCVTRGPTATVYRSDDGARTWRRLSRDLRAAGVRNIAVAPANPRRLYLTARHYYEKNRGVFPGGVYRSDDGGVTWHHVPEDRFAEGLAVDPRDANVVYAGLTDHPYHNESTGRGIFGSRDGGRTWTSLNGIGLSCRHITTITIDPNQPGDDI